MDIYKNVDALFADPIISKIIEGCCTNRPNTDTARVYRSVLKNFFLWCQTKNISPLHAGKDGNVEYLRHLVGRGLDNTTVAHRLNVLRSFYKEAVLQGFIENYPLVGVSVEVSQFDRYGRTDTFDSEQVTKIINNLPTGKTEEELRLKVLVALMLIEGLKPVELHRLSTEHINSRGHKIKIEGKSVVQFMELRQDVWELLDAYLKIRTEPIKDVLGTPVFVATGNRARGKRLSRDSMRAFFNKECEMAGMKKMGRSCSALRHTCGAMIYDETNGDVALVKEELRFASLRDASRYQKAKEVVCPKSHLPTITGKHDDKAK